MNLLQAVMLLGGGWILSSLLRAFSLLGRLLASSHHGFILADGAPPSLAAPSTLWVISAARNEAQRLPLWASALKAQLLDDGITLRVLLVDDASSDGSLRWAEAEAARWPALQLLKARGEGKSAALAEAIRHLLKGASDEDAVLFTDADCSPAAGWAQAHLEALAAGGGLVGGHVALELEDSPGNRLRLLESGISTLQCALSSLAGSPAYMRGGNWSTRAGLLREAGGLDGKEALSSGDDLLLPARLLAAGARPGALTGRESWVHAAEASDRDTQAASSRRRNGKWRLLPARTRVSRSLLILSLAAFTLPMAMPGMLAAWGPLWSLASVGLAALGLLLLKQGLAVYDLSIRAEDPLHLFTLAVRSVKGIFDSRPQQWKGRNREVPRA